MYRPCHWYDFQPADGNARVESSPHFALALGPNPQYCISPRQTSSATLDATHLHSAPYHFKGVRSCLTDSTGHRAAREIGQCLVIRHHGYKVGYMPLEGTVCQERNSCVGDHADECDRESTVERCKRLDDWYPGAEELLSRNGRSGLRNIGYPYWWMMSLLVYHFDYLSQAGSFRGFGLIR